MDLHICTNGDRNGEAGRFAKALSDHFARVPCKHFSSFDELGGCIKRPFGRAGVTVLIPDGNEAMAQLAHLRPLLDDSRLILVLPDRHEKTVNRAHRLNPRYISYLDGDPSEVAAVIRKMIGLH